MGNDESGFFDTRRGADYLGLSPCTLDGYRVSGNDPAFRRFGNRVRYRRPDLDAWAAGAAGDHDGGNGQARERHKGRLSVAVECRSIRPTRRGAPRYLQAHPRGRADRAAGADPRDRPSNL